MTDIRLTSSESTKCFGDDGNGNAGIVADALKQELRSQLVPFGQDHVLNFWDELDTPARRRLAEQIRQLDLDDLDRLIGDERAGEDWAELARRAVGPPAIRLESSKNRFSFDEARRRGREALDSGKVGILLVAGGQGTRLGFPYPKGMYRIGPVSNASLFQILIEKVVALANRHAAEIPLYLMTSPATHEETVEFLRRNDRFGLGADDLVVFCQGTMPAVDAETGRLLLENRGTLAVSPDGHGGMLAALERSGALDNICRRGLELLFYHQVDNPLARVGDAEFIGFHLLSESEVSTQVVAKKEPEERVGNVVSVDGQVHIIEYSDLPAEAACRRGGDGSLELWAGNTAIHVFNVAFLARMVGRPDRLPFHLARKKVSYVDSRGEKIEPRESNAIKFERFIFDLLPAASCCVVVEIDPQYGFAPVKNAPGADRDSPEAVQSQMVALSRRWLAHAGARVADGVLVEISPLFSLDAEELADKIEPGLRVTENRYFR